MTIPGKGVSAPAEFPKVISDLFQNEILHNLDGTHIEYYFSRLELTPDQQSHLTYPSGFVPLNKYLYYQTDQYDHNDTLLSTLMGIISFATKEKDYTYGFYFTLQNQPRFEPETLTKSHHPVGLSSSAALFYGAYLEMYYDINHTTTILALSNAVDNVYASLQYRHGSKYIYNVLTMNGVLQPDLPETRLKGLSDNLEKMSK